MKIWWKLVLNYISVFLRNIRPSLHWQPPLSFATLGSCNFWTLWLQFEGCGQSLPAKGLDVADPNTTMSHPLSCLWGFKGMELHSKWKCMDFSNGICVDVAMLANETCLWSVAGPSASARVSSKVSLVTTGGTSKSGSWLTLEAALLIDTLDSMLHLFYKIYISLHILLTAYDIMHMHTFPIFSSNHGWMSHD